jgi:serine/threonine protein kinase
LQYETLHKVGEGTYGVVYKAKHKASGEYVALKKIRLDTDDDGIPTAAIREISLLKQLQHQNIVRLFDVVHTEKKLMLVFEYIDEDLKKYLEPYKTGEVILEATTVKNLLRQLLSAVNHCHYHRVLHRDLKPQNILINLEGPILKLADFGLARTYGIPVRKYTQDVVTLWYRAPEILLGCAQYSTQVDMWSVGCIFAELVTGRALFQGDTDENQIKVIFSSLGPPDVKQWPQVVNLSGYRSEMQNYSGKSIRELVKGLEDDEEGLDLLTQMLAYNPDHRISAEAALNHPYFKDKSKQKKKKLGV